MKLSRSNVYSSIILLLLGASDSFGYQVRSPRTKVQTPASPPDSTRRFTVLAFPAIAMASGILASNPSRSEALDMDSFIAKELDNKKEPPKMSDDEALCKYGQPSKATGNACLRAGLSTKRPTGVDAFGTVDRKYNNIIQHCFC